MKEGNIGLEKVLDVCRSDEVVRKQMTAIDNAPTIVTLKKYRSLRNMIIRLKEESKFKNQKVSIIVIKMSKL